MNDFPLKWKQKLADYYTFVFYELGSMDGPYTYIERQGLALKMKLHIETWRAQ